MRACADAAAVSLPPQAPDPARLRRDLKARAGQAARLYPVHDAYAALFAAETARAGGSQTVTGWDAAAAAWERVGQPYPHGLRADAGRGRRRGGDRDEAAARLHRAAGLAGQLAAQPLQQQISQLARRARIPLPSPGQRWRRAARAFGLTAREQEVLQLVAAGRSNREIAAELFISPAPPACTSPTSSASSRCPRGARPPLPRTGCTCSTSPDRPAGCGAPRCRPELIPYLMQAAGA